MSDTEVNMLEVPPEILPDFLRRQQQILEERTAYEIVRRLSDCVPWRSDLPWNRELNLVGSSYQIDEPFPHIEPLSIGDRILEPSKLTQESFLLSADSTFMCVRRTLPRGCTLSTIQGVVKGSVLFDSDVVFSILLSIHLRDRGGHYVIWMSMTPLEVMTLRTGTRMSRGHVVIAGLGLGHQLVEVSKRPSVKRVTLVERSRELVDWMLPAIEKYRVQKPLDVVIGDAYEEVPKLEADVALIDIFRKYGNNGPDVGRIRQAATRIKKVWGWGCASF